MPDSPAARAKDEALDLLSQACADTDPRSWPESRKAEEACREAIDRAIDLAVEEAAQKWGHVRHCQCHDDPTDFKYPAWRCLATEPPDAHSHPFRDPCCAPEVKGA